MSYNGITTVNYNGRSTTCVSVRSFYSISIRVINYCTNNISCCCLIVVLNRYGSCAIYTRSGCSKLHSILRMRERLTLWMSISNSIINSRVFCSRRSSKANTCRIISSDCSSSVIPSFSGFYSTIINCELFG